MTQWIFDLHSIFTFNYFRLLVKSFQISFTISSFLSLHLMTLTMLFVSCFILLSKKILLSVRADIQHSSLQLSQKMFDSLLGTGGCYLWTRYQQIMQTCSKFVTKDILFFVFWQLLVKLYLWLYGRQKRRKFSSGSSHRPSFHGLKT